MRNDLPILGTKYARYTLCYTTPEGIPATTRNLSKAEVESLIAAAAKEVVGAEDFQTILTYTPND